MKPNFEVATTYIQIIRALKDSVSFMWLINWFIHYSAFSAANAM